MGLRELLSFTTLVKEINEAFVIGCSKSKIKYRFWEDNASYIAAAESKKPPLRTKHIALKYHFFREAIARRDAVMSDVDAHHQLADILDKPIDDKQFFTLMKSLIGW